MQQPFLTIGIASFNYVQYLERAIAQIKKQKFKDIEVLYCDDGSTDGSIEKIREIIAIEKDINIRLIRGEHLGILENRNRILENAKGKYLMICDADDCMTDDCLEELCLLAQQTNADCIIGGFCEVDDGGKMLKKHIPSSKSSKWLYTWHHGQIYKLDIIKDNNIRFGQLPDDVMYLQNIHRYCKKVYFVSKCIYRWYRHRNSASTNFEENTEWHPVKLWEEISTYIGEICNEAVGQDEKDLKYYLYKWYYFNVTDLCRDKKEDINCNLNKISNQMEKITPGYLKWASLPIIFGANDTFFARFAVTVCFMLEKIHMLKCVVYIRNFQKRLKNSL